MTVVWSANAPIPRRRTLPALRREQCPAERRAFGVLWIAMALVLLALAPPAGAALPDHRGIELVTRYTNEGSEVGLGGADPVFTAGAANGEAVDWESLGACCGSSTGGVNVYQSQRDAEGWQARVLSPTPSKPLSGLYEEQAPVFWSSNLAQTIFATPASYATGNERPKGSDADNLYLQSPTGTLTWLSQGPAGGGTSSDGARFDGATPNLEEVIFSTAEPLTANAAGLNSEKEAEYLYARNVRTATTTLINVEAGGKLISPYGARLGNDGPPKEGLFSLAASGSTTHAVSEDGSKIYFETPPESTSLPEGVEPHLYLRDLATNTTTTLDNPTSTGSAQYEGASTNGSLAFFTSDEGLDGASTDKELYEFNSTAAAVGSAPAMSSIPIGGGTGVLGVVAISNDGSHVFFIAETVLAANANSHGQSAIAAQPNLYMYDTTSGETTFIATVAVPDISTCRPTCASTEELRLTGLVGEPDVYRPAAVTPDGSVFVFTSANNLTGEDHAPTTTLTEPAYAEEHRIRVTSTAGFDARHTIGIGSGADEELEVVEKVDSSTELTLEEYGPGIVDGFAHEHPEGSEVSEVNAEVYRYDTVTKTLACISCTPAGVFSSGPTSLGEGGGGSYAPNGHLAPMNEDGSQIFFESPDPLTTGAGEAQTTKLFEPRGVYEWEGGTVSLIAAGSQNTAELNGATPSGDDVFFSTRTTLAPGAVAGYRHIYDARVNGGFPEPPPPSGEPCSVEACRPLNSGGQGESVAPASATLGGVSEVSPEPPAEFAVNKITTTQLNALERTGRLTLTVSATKPGELTASATTRLHGRIERAAHGTAIVESGPETVKLTLALNKAAQAALAKAHALSLRVEVFYSASGISKGIDIKLTALKHPASHARA
jgi:hypothetical protein